MLRTSSYTIYVDLPHNNEDMLLVHGYTGAYDKVSRRTATYLRGLDTRRPPRPLFGAWSPEPAVEDTVASPSTQTLEILQRRGYLTEKSVEEEEKYLCQIADTLHQHACASSPNYVFMPTYDCNLRCSYCFQDHMRTESAFEHLLKVMSRSQIDTIFQAMPQIEARYEAEAHGQIRRTVGFFGGEPLLARTRSAVEYIIMRAHELGVRSFWAVTNATELEAYEDLLGEQGIMDLQITIDGPEEEHNKRRVYADGTGSFRRIARNVTMALDRGANVAMRINADRNNISDLPVLADTIVAFGWDRYSNFRTYSHPIHAVNKHTDPKTTFTSWQLDKTLNQLREEFPNLRVIERPDDPLKDRARLILRGAGTPYMQSSFCGANTSMYILDAFGDIYACWERTGDAKIRIGHIDSHGEPSFNSMNMQWRSRTVATNPICRRCRYALHCGGGCAVLAEGERGAFFTNHCDGYAARFRASIAA